MSVESAWAGMGGLVVGLVAAVAAPARRSASYARITIHKAVCPGNTGDVFGKRHEDRLGGVPFRVHNPNGHGTTRTTAPTAWPCGGLGPATT